MEPGSNCWRKLEDIFIREVNLALSEFLILVNKFSNWMNQGRCIMGYCSCKCALILGTQIFKEIRCYSRSHKILSFGLESCFFLKLSMFLVYDFVKSYWPNKHHYKWNKSLTLVPNTNILMNHLDNGTLSNKLILTECKRT